MACVLDKFTTYTLGQVVHDKADGKIMVQLSDPPAKCPDRSFTTHTGEIIVQDGIGPILTFDKVKNHPVVIVPRKEIVDEVAHPMSFVQLLLFFVFAAAVLYAVYH